MFNVDSVKDFYGRLELKQKYQRYFSLAFLLSIIIHLIVLVFYFLIYNDNEDIEEKTPVLRITMYDVGVPPAIGNGDNISSVTFGVPTIIQSSEISENRSPVKNPAVGKKGNSNKIPGNLSGKKIIPRSGSPLGDGMTGLSDSKLSISENRQTNSKIGVSNESENGTFPLQGGKGIKSGRVGKGEGNSSDKINPGGISGSDLIGNKNFQPSDRPGGIGKEISNFTVTWKEGGTRSKISGSLPRCPELLTKSVQIKISITVLPNGTVSKALPLQKGDFNLEKEAIQTILTWKFEPLKTSNPQSEQKAIVTFLFRLE